MTKKFRPVVIETSQNHGMSSPQPAFLALLVFARRRVGIACLPIPILIGLSRMYLGAHYLSEVVCAAVLRILCAAVVWRFVAREAAITKH